MTSKICNIKHEVKFHLIINSTIINVLKIKPKATESKNIYIHNQNHSAHKDSEVYHLYKGPINQQHPSCYSASQMNLCQSGWLPSSFLRSITSSVACHLLIQVASYTQLWTVSTAGSAGKIKASGKLPHTRTVYFVWRKHENISPCTGSRVNTNDECIASWGGCQCWTRDPRILVWEQRFLLCKLAEKYKLCNDFPAYPFQTIATLQSSYFF